jgi:LacI family transcriptional regulator
MAKSSITINDIAKELNVAPSTVSRALNDSSKISNKTKTLIREKAAELGYDLNMIASGLSRKQTNFIGVVIPSINRHFYSMVVSGIEELAFDSGYRVLITQTNDSQTREEEMMRLLSSARVDGIIACLSLKTNQTSHLQKIKNNGIPLVLFDRVKYEIPCHRIVIDNYDAAFQSVTHLARSGCKRIAYLGGPLGCNTFEEQARGYREALKREGLPLLPKYLFSTDLTPEDVTEAIKIWNSLDEKPDAIVASGSTPALMLAKLVKEAGLSIPNDLSVVSIGSEPALKYVDPQISAVELPGIDIGKTAMQFILDEINNQTQEFSTVIKPFQFTIRNSSFK